MIKVNSENKKCIITGYIKIDGLKINTNDHVIYIIGISYCFPLLSCWHIHVIHHCKLYIPFIHYHPHC